MKFGLNYSKDEEEFEYAISLLEPSETVNAFTGFFDNNVYSFYKIVKLTAMSGYPYPNRSGIWIHGGRSQTSLTVTYECVRVFNADQKRIQDTLTNWMLPANGHNTTGRVLIAEHDYLD